VPCCQKLQTAFSATLPTGVYIKYVVPAIQNLETVKRGTRLQYIYILYTYRYDDHYYRRPYEETVPTRDRLPPPQHDRFRDAPPPGIG